MPSFRAPLHTQQCFQRFCADTNVSERNCADEAELRRVLGQPEFAAALLSGTTADDRRILESNKQHKILLPGGVVNHERVIDLLLNVPGLTGEPAAKFDRSFKDFMRTLCPVIAADRKKARKRHRAE